MLTVLTPATSTRLTTVARARDLLGFTSKDNAVAQVCIDQASRAIADYCRRPFGRETVRETFRDVVRGDGLQLSRSPVTAFVSVTSDDTALLATEYELDLETGLLYRLDGSGSRYQWYWGSSLIVDYTAGYTLPPDGGTWTLPEPVERATIQEVGAYLSSRKRDPLVKAQDIEGVSSTSWWVPGTGATLASPEAEALLQPYRRLF